MTFAQLFAALPDASAPPALAEAEATALCIDSRKVVPGSLFVSVPGTNLDGRDFAAAALAAGAALVAGEGAPPAGVPPERWVRVTDARRAVPRLACAFHGNPSHALAVFAVTGTNGKTTTATLLRAVLAESGIPCGLLSTVLCDLGDRTLPADQTTPDATVLQGHLAHMRTAGCRAACMEVSSHALDQHRVDGIRFAAAAFTNLTQDHLDYHGTMEAYGLAKRKLFEQLARQPEGLAVVNLDDPWGHRLLAWLRENAVPTATYGLDGAADFRAEGLELGVRETRFRLVSPKGLAEVCSPLLGRHNVSNLLAVAAMASAAGIGTEQAAAILSRQPTVRGRLERVHAPAHPASLFVDYAHTPDALERVLATLREVTHGRLVVVFGCGGNRDRGKRPLMGRIAHALADHVVVTSDNPRQEPPGDIIAEILAGMPPGAAPVVQPDRREAIRAALTLADRPTDVVLIAGKGHETTQVFADRILHFDDREELLRIAAERRE